MRRLRAAALVAAAALAAACDKHEDGQDDWECKQDESHAGDTVLTLKRFASRAPA
jgi:hypothetical protein